MRRWFHSRDRYERECAEYDARLEAVNPGLVRALTEDGIEIRVKLWTYYPGYYGTCRID